MSRAKNQKGVAMILALLLVLATSVIAISLVSVSRTEGFASMNYRLMSQSRDAAEGGVHKAANYIMNSYTKPGAVSDPMSNYTTTASPVTYGGNPVVLSAGSSTSSNYPVAGTQTSFSSAAQGNVTAGSSTVTYKTKATLLSMQQITPYGTTTPATIQTWSLTSDGSVNGMQNADVEVTSTLEQQAVPVFTYAAFATSSGCSALQFGGGGSTDSYDSAHLSLSGGVPVTQASSGSVGTNGNLATNGNTTTINGNLATPRTGVGSCSANNVTAWTDSNGHVTGSIIELPQSVSYPTPSAPNPLPPTTSMTLNNKSSDCNGVAGCSYSGGNFSFAPGACSGTPATYGNVTVKGTLILTAGCYNFNTLTENGQGAIQINSGPVIINLAALDSSGNPLTGTVMDLTGGGVINTVGWDPTQFQVLYAGSGTINMKGGANAVGLLYAPNASFSFNSAGGNWYGAVVVGNMTDMGGATVNYDRHLNTTAMVVGPYTLGSFTWKKY